MIQGSVTPITIQLDPLSPEILIPPKYMADSIGFGTIRPKTFGILFLLNIPNKIQIKPKEAKTESHEKHPRAVVTELHHPLLPVA